MKQIGIEKINIYAGPMFMKQTSLAEDRGKDPEKVVSDFLINTRSVFPPYEDTVTMGANAAKPILTEEDKQDIGMLIVGTEGSVDFGKPISTNIHSALGLPPNVRNYETKHACYSGVAALDTAINWIAGGLNHGKKALVISTDFSRMHLGAKEEFVLGGVAAALLISEHPTLLEFEGDKRGTWTTNAYDTFRPSARAEVGNNEVSLFTYMDALEGAWEDFVAKWDNGFSFDNDLYAIIYHTPFPGMSFQAHRTLCNINQPRKKAEVKEDFNKRVLPVLRYSRRVGSTYGSSNFVGIVSLLSGESPEDLAGKRLGFFAYGSGAIGEFYSGVLLPGTASWTGSKAIEEHFNSRIEVSVPEYEELEKIRDSYIENPNFVSDLSSGKDIFDRAYKGKGLLYLKEVKDYYRTYEWS
jgi:hydroxymethylglutaryl-CoA synthase